MGLQTVEKCGSKVVECSVDEIFLEHLERQRVGRGRAVAKWTLERLGLKIPRVGRRFEVTSGFLGVTDAVNSNFKLSLEI